MILWVNCCRVLVLCVIPIGCLNCFRLILIGLFNYFESRIKIRLICWYVYWLNLNEIDLLLEIRDLIWGFWLNCGRSVEWVWFWLTANLNVTRWHTFWFPHISWLPSGIYDMACSSNIYVGRLTNVTNLYILAENTYIFLYF